MEFRKLASVSEASKKRCQLVYASYGKTYHLVLLYVKGKFYALEDSCVHIGGPLHQGDIEDVGGRACVRCPWHGYLYDVETGDNPQLPGLAQRVREVKVEDDHVFIKMPCDISLQPIKK